MANRRQPPHSPSNLESFGSILSRRLAASSQPLAFAREREIGVLLRNLEHGRRKSCLLVGPSGCGKTAVYYEFFRQISGRRKPWVIVETSSSRVLRGTEYIGQWQTRLHELIEQADAAQRVALYWTGIQYAATAGSSAKSDDNMAAVIAPYIESGDLVVFGECTEDAFRLGIEPNPWFEKLFTVCRIQPQPDETVYEVVNAVAAARSADLRQDVGLDLTWTESGLRALIQFGSIYFPGTAAPGGALRLMDHFANEKRTEVESGQRRRGAIKVAYEHVIPALESLTGVPSQILDDSRPLRSRQVNEFFASRIIGQPRAVNAVVDLVMLVKAGLADPSKPLGVLLFCGPTGVGKTEMAKALAEFLFGSRDRLVRLDMSEYQDYYAAIKIIGTPELDARAGAPAGTLLSRIHAQPFSVVLLDEIEKAHPNVFDLFLQLFDDGRLSDASGQTTSFTQTIVIMTSNLGSDLATSAPMGFLRDAERSTADHLSTEIEHFFRPELINRIDRIVHFQQLTAEDVKVLAKRELGQVLMRQGITRRHLRIDVDAGVVELLAREGFDPRYGARPLKRAVERLALLPLARELAQTTADNRPALIRLLPAEDRIILKIIHDRQTRKSESIEKGVVISNRAGKRKRVKPREIEAALVSLRASLTQIEGECQERDLTALKSRLVAQTGAIGFWDDPAEAREVMTDLYRIERLLEVIQRLNRQINRLNEKYAWARDQRHEQQMKNVAQEIVAVMKHIEVVGFSLRCDDRLDRCDAFLTITAVEQADQDVAGYLVDMYSNWARRKGFSVRMVHEELFASKSTRSIVILIEGVAIYGLLRNEDGVHEFVEGKTSRLPRRCHYVNVRVSPVVEDITAAKDRFQVKTVRATGSGQRCKRFRSEVAASDRRHGREIHLRNDLSATEARTIAIDLLNAESHRTASETENSEDSNGQTVVRRYTLGPTQSAKDSRSKVVTHHLRELWNGALDPFLAGNLSAHVTQRPVTKNEAPKPD